MPKICVALIKGKENLFPHDLSIGITRDKSRHMRKAVAIVNHKSGIVKRSATSKFCVTLIKEKAATKELTLIAADRTPTVLRHNGS